MPLRRLGQPSLSSLREPLDRGCGKYVGSGPSTAIASGPVRSMPGLLCPGLPVPIQTGTAVSTGDGITEKVECGTAWMELPGRPTDNNSHGDPSGSVRGHTSTALILPSTCSGNSASARAMDGPDEGALVESLHEVVVRAGPEDIRHVSALIPAAEHDEPIVSSRPSDVARPVARLYGAAMRAQPQT